MDKQPNMEKLTQCGFTRCSDLKTRLEESIRMAEIIVKTEEGVFMARKGLKRFTMENPSPTIEDAFAFAFLLGAEYGICKILDKGNS
ncbi:MAG: hypothetical protein IMZ61_15245 [Planctomycetes bacterium]|nr:hypothetical protein [Planctomycetota bacterium]